MAATKARAGFAVDKGLPHPLGATPLPEGSPSIEDSERYSELDSRSFTVNLPPAHTVQALVRAMPGLAGAQPSAACWQFLSAIGISRSSALAN